MSDKPATDMADLLGQINTHNIFFASRLIFPDSKFHEAMKALLALASTDGPRWPPSPNQAEPLIRAIESPALAREIADQAGKYKVHKEDKSLIDRWRGIQSFALYLLTGQGSRLDEAIKAFNALGPLGEWPRPDDSDPIVNRFRVGSDGGRGSDLWSAGTYLVYDLLASLFLPREEQRIDREQTPILVVNEVPNVRSATALWLTVERRRGGDGLIQPDWWSLGLLALSGAAEENFRTAIEEALRAAQPKRDYRYSWRLSYHTGIRPEAVSGQSAQASAASCVLALNEQTPQNPGPLLDEKAAISACLGKWANVALDEIALKQVDADWFEDKLQAAAQAGLHGLVFCRGQWPERQTAYEYAATVKGQKQEPHRVFLLGVPTLLEGYDSLLLTSKAIRAYKQDIVIDWRGGLDERGQPLRDKDGKVRGRWIEEETHEDFKNASRSTS